MEEPAILKKLIDFINFWNNPKKEQGESFSLSVHALRIYDVSYDFWFKWIVSDDELKEVSNFLNIKIKDDKLYKTTYSEIIKEITFGNIKANIVGGEVYFNNNDLEKVFQPKK